MIFWQFSNILLEAGIPRVLVVLANFRESNIIYVGFLLGSYCVAHFWACVMGGKFGCFLGEMFLHHWDMVSCYYLNIVYLRGVVSCYYLDMERFFRLMETRILGQGSEYAPFLPCLCCCCQDFCCSLCCCFYPAVGTAWLKFGLTLAKYRMKTSCVIIWVFFVAWRLAIGAR